jgi:hypothetical protein
MTNFMISLTNAPHIQPIQCQQAEPLANIKGGLWP